MIEKENLPEEFKRYFSKMEAEKYEYTAGKIGEEFLISLRDEMKIKAAYCEKCNRLILPPKMFCIFCGNEIKELKEIGNEGYIASYTRVVIDERNNRIEKPKIVAFIKFPNVEGGILHYIEDFEENKELLNAKVIPVFNEKRNGSLNDIKYFKPVY